METKEKEVKELFDKLLNKDITLLPNEDIKTLVEKAIDCSWYDEATNLVAKYYNIKLKVISSYYGVMKWDTKNKREVFKLQLLRGKKSYTFEFGQSAVKGNEEPTLYDVLTCLQKYEVGTFEDFCGEFGYDNDSRTAEKTYKAVVKEFKAMERLFNSEELEVLQLIQ
jgi:hypothetical protein